MFVSPFVTNPYAPVNLASNLPVIPVESPVSLPHEQALPTAIQYGADLSGCGFWRLYWPSHLLNANQEMMVYDLTRMVLDDRFYRGIKSIRVQRQASEDQLKFVRILKQMSAELGFHLIYEIDDIAFFEDIPEYNKFRNAFANPTVRATMQEIMLLCDEMTVTCPYMRDYYMQKTGHPNVTVIPNCPPRWWIGNFYNEKEISQRFDKNRKQPRILYPGSGAHFDVDCRVKFKDDFEHVNEAVIKTRHKFKWVFLGAFPYAVRQYIQNGEMEFHPWQTFYEYPRFIHSLGVNAMVAPLQHNVFNRAKSDLKYLEASCYGLPIACEDIETYANAPFRFTTGDGMVAHLESFFKSKDNYMKISKKARAFAESRFLENPNNIGKFKELLCYKKGSPERVLLK